MDGRRQEILTAGTKEKRTQINDEKQTQILLMVNTKKFKVLFIFSFQNPATCFMTYDIYVGIVIHVWLYHIFLDKFENFNL